jgi:hypothetical protein
MCHERFCFFPGPRCERLPERFSIANIRSNLSIIDEVNFFVVGTTHVNKIAWPKCAVIVTEFSIPFCAMSRAEMPNPSAFRTRMVPEDRATTALRFSTLDRFDINQH